MSDIFLRVLFLSLSGSIVALAGAVLCLLLGKRLSKAWRYYLWLLVLLRLVVPFAPQGNNLMDLLAAKSTSVVPHAVAGNTPPQSLPSSVEPDVRNVAVSAPAAQAAAPEAIAPAQTVAPAPEEDRGRVMDILRELWQYAWVVWLGVALMLWVRLVTSYHSFARFIRAGWRPVDDPAILDTLGEVSGLCGVKKAVPLYLNPLAASPMLVGIFRPVIVLPTCQLQSENLRYILAHELVHYKRKDILYKWFAQAVSCLHWFNPMVHLVRKDIHVACELSCDEQLLFQLRGASHRKYGDTLLAVLQTSGNYGDTVASVTMSEEGKMMKKRLQSIASPYRRSKGTLCLSLMLVLLLLVGASYAGAYTGTASTEIPVEEVIPTGSPAPEATREPTPGERLDQLLGDMDELKDSLGAHATEWGNQVAEKAEEWGQDWIDAWDWEGVWDWTDAWGWQSELDQDEGMFSSFRTANLTLINEGYFQNGYILHLQYVSTGQIQAEDTTVLEGPAIVLPETRADLAQDEAFLAALQSAADAFAQKHSDVPVRDGYLRLVSVDGPYTESPDELLSRFHQSGQLGHFVAVLNGGQTSLELRLSLLRDAAQKDDVATFSILLGTDIPTDTVDELLREAFDRRNVALFYILADYASAEAKQSVKDAAVRAGAHQFIAGFDEAPSPESIDALLDEMGEDGLDPGVVALLADNLTAEQALRIATAAYEQDDVAVFSIVMDSLTAEEVAAFHEMAYEDRKMSFYTLTSW